MKKLLFSLLVMILACSSNTMKSNSTENKMKSNSTELYNKITTGIYVFDEKKPGEYNLIKFKQDGTIEGANYLFLNDDVQWKEDKEKPCVINIYSNNSNIIYGYIYFIDGYNSEYNGNYQSVKDYLNFLEIVTTDKKIFAYTSSSFIANTIIDEFKSKARKKEAVDEINKFLSSVDRTKIYFLDFSDLKEYESLNTIAQYKELSYYGLFDEAYFNKKENPNILNNFELDDDEFVYREKKPVYAEIRKKKYLFIHSDITNENIKLEISEYDFNKKGYYCTIKRTTPIGGVMGVGPFEIIEMVSKPFFVSINETEAREFKNHKIQFSIIAELSAKTKQIKVTRIKINEAGITDVAVNETLWKAYKEKYIQHASKCYISNEKIKQLNLNVINYQITDTDTDISYTNIK